MRYKNINPVREDLTIGSDNLKFLKYMHSNRNKVSLGVQTKFNYALPPKEEIDSEVPM